MLKIKMKSLLHVITTVLVLILSQSMAAYGMENLEDESAKPTTNYPSYKDIEWADSCLSLNEEQEENSHFLQQHKTEEKGGEGQSEANKLSHERLMQVVRALLDADSDKVSQLINSGQ